MEQKTLGAFLAVLRKANGMTQKELAERVGVSDKTISHWERDESAPDISVLPVLADIFGVTVDELLRGEKCAAGEGAADALTPKSEKQLQYLLEKKFHRFQLSFWASLAASLIGVLFAILLYEWIAAPGALIAAIFTVAAILIVGIAESNFRFSVKDTDFSEVLLQEYRRKSCVYRRLAFCAILSLDALVVGVTLMHLVPYRLSLLFPLPFIVAVVVLLMREQDVFKD